MTMNNEKLVKRNERGQMIYNKQHDMEEFFSYDEEGRIVNYSNTLGMEIEYEHFELMRREIVSNYVTGEVVVRVYDNFGRLIRCGQGGTTERICYDPRGFISKIYKRTGNTPEELVYTRFVEIC